MARFINHSCDPNCKLVPINVAGQMRISIVCIRDVSPGGFLSYDYQFDTQHGEKFICRCGAENCRGTMQGGRAEDKMVDKKSKKQLLSEAKSRMLRDKKFLQTMFLSEKDRLYLTGPFVPGVDMGQAEMVAGGPKKKDFRETKNVFLWRNAKDGANFSSRYWTFLDRKKSKKKKARQSLAAKCSELIKVDVVSFVNSVHSTAKLTLE